MKRTKTNKKQTNEQKTNKHTNKQNKQTNNIQATGESLIFTYFQVCFYPRIFQS
jgi:hypothetical protein